MEGNNTEKLLACLVSPFQSLENVLQQLLIERSVDTAVGTQLDVIGKIVGQARNGLDDDTYRRYVRARVSTNKSTGVVADLITVTELVVYDDDAYYKVENQGTATIKVTVEDIAITQDLADTLLAFLKDTVSAGIRLVLQYGVSAPSELFQLDVLGWDQGKLAGAMDNA